MPLWLTLCLLCCSHRVLEQHKLTKEQWEDRIQTWHEEHKDMLRYVDAPEWAGWNRVNGSVHNEVSAALIHH